MSVRMTGADAQTRVGAGPIAGCVGAGPLYGLPWCVGGAGMVGLQMLVGIVK